MPKIVVLDTEARWNMKAEDEHLWWPRIQWIDPGTVSGMAVVWFDPKAVFDGSIMAKTVLAYSEMFLSGPENGSNGQIFRYMSMREQLMQEKGLASGIESFTVRAANMSHEFLSPVRIRAGIEYAMSVEEELAQLHTQSPSDALSVFTNERLSRLRMYTPGPDHVNDAKRHALLWIQKLRKVGREQFALAHGEESGWWE